MMMDRIFLSGFLNANLGSVDVERNGTWSKETDIAGFAGDLRLAYRYGQTVNDIISIEGIYSSGDDDALLDKKYNGVITGNTWGTPAGLLIGTGAYILFPHSYVVNRYVAAVTDLSNMGYGISALVINAKRDFIPNKLNAKVGTAMAYSNVEPSGGGKFMGYELNCAVEYTLGTYMSVGAHAAIMNLGDFYDSNESRYGFDINGTYTSTRPVDPWTAFLTFKWLMF